jgi:hypothetical protein
MFIREDARVRAKELAAKGLSKQKIRKQLEQEGMQWLLDDHALESIVTECRAMSRFQEPKVAKILPRVIGVIALLFVAWRYIAIFHMKSLGIRDWFLLIAGIIMIIKPSAAKEEVR